MDKRAIVAMSGGVDSSVAALLVQQAGYEAMGVTLRLHGEGQGPDPAEDARAAAARLGLDFKVLDFSESFREQVVERFVAAYQRGETPNPCIDCNRYVKFGRLMAWARERGFAKVASGHYARVEQDEKTGRWLLKKGLDPRKDQSYVLYALTQGELSMLLLPLGGLTKAQVRQLARDRGFENAGKQESQDICFIPDGDYLAFLQADGVSLHPGHFIAPDGMDLGAHKGMEAYTIGQRRGLEVAYGSRIYVVDKEPGGNVRLGPDEALYRRHVAVEQVNFIPFDTLDAPRRAQAKIRYSQQAAPCTLRPRDGGVEVIFDAPQRAVTPGQSAVFYDGPLLLGGGIIRAAW